MTAAAGASRMSSVRGLNASPQTAMTLPFRVPRWAAIRGTRTRRCASLAASTALTTRRSRPASSAVLIRALTSFGKHDPPYPIPGKRKEDPIRESVPMPRRTWPTSAPMRSHRFAISFMNEMRLASIALAAYFVSSADAQSMTRTGLPVRTKGA